MAFNYQLGYDPDKDYSLAILQAKNETERAALRQERENKIMDMYGGIDPYKGEHADIIRGYGDPSGYLSALYAENTAAELHGLQAAYEKNAAAEKANLAAIAPKYYAARNTVSAQSEVEKRNFARFGAARGINTGAASQAELARSVALQSDLAALYERELSEKAEGEAKLRELEAEYQLSRAAAEAKGKSELAAAQYDEWVRKSEAEEKQAQKAADAAYDTAMALLKAGVMPESATLEAAGISQSDAASLAGAVRGQKTAKSSTKSSSKKKTADNKEESETQPSDAITSYDGLSPAAKGMYTSFQLQMRRSGYPYMTNSMRTNLFEAYMANTISRREYSFIMKSLDG